MDPTTLYGIAVLLLIILAVVVPVVVIRSQLQQIARLKADVLRWQAELRTILEAMNAPRRQAVTAYTKRPRPLEQPPTGVFPTIERVHRDYPDDPYVVPMGWELIEGQPELVVVSLYGDSPIKSGHMLLTGETDWGKDSWAFLAAATLCARTTPRQLQICWIDGKGPDGALWKEKAHNWREPVTNADTIGEAIATLETERERRAQLLQRAAVTKWEELPNETRPPLLWVFVSELRLLKKPLGSELETWLERELASARACGIRYCVATQTVTNMKTEWRSQIGCYVAGGQSSRDGDKPNTGLSTEEIRELGALPPSELTAPGFFTVRVRRDIATVRASRIDLADRKAYLERLPDRPSVLPFPSIPSTAPESAGSLFPESSTPADMPGAGGGADGGRTEDWTPDQRDRVEQLIAEGKKSDGQIAAEVFNVTGGRKYRPLVERIAMLRRNATHAMSA